MVGPLAASGSVITLVDITRGKKSQDALSVGEEMYRRLYESTALGATQRDPEGKVPVHLPWHEDYALGHPLIDAQHKELLDFGNRLLSLTTAGATQRLIDAALDDLLKHVARHFKDEEAILLEIGYPEVKAHQAAHQQLLEAAAQIKKNVSLGRASFMGLMNFLANQVIREHMLMDDAAFKSWLPAPA
jgi:hemerythrin